MKTISIPSCLYVALAQLEDKDAGQIAKAIARYAEEGKEPSFSNSLLKAFFTLFREQIDEQRNAYEQRRVVNTQNAQRKSVKKRVATKKSDSQPIASSTEPVEEQPIPLQRIIDVYPKVGTYSGESQITWDLLSESEKQHAIDFVPVYLGQTPSPTAQFYLNQYLKAKPWESEGQML